MTAALMVGGGRVPALGMGSGKTLESLAADIELANAYPHLAGAVNDFTLDALAELNAKLRNVTISVADAPYAHWVVSGPPMTRSCARRPYVAHIPMCCCGLTRELGVIYTDDTHKTVERVQYASLPGGNCTCNVTKPPRHHRLTTCHQWHGVRVLELARRADRTYSKRRAPRARSAASS